jgi:hypothetical protein
MNIKLSPYLLLGLGAVTSTILCNFTPVRAQIAGGNDNGSGREAISAPLHRGSQSPEISQRQKAIDQFSQSLTANSVGDAATFDVLNGAAPAQLVAALLPNGIAADGATGKAATRLATTVQGMRSGNGQIDPTKLKASIGDFNNYVKALVGEVGADKALATAPVGQKALQGLFTQLVQVASQAVPAVPAPPKP